MSLQGEGPQIEAPVAGGESLGGNTLGGGNDVFTDLANIASSNPQQAFNQVLDLPEPPPVEMPEPAAPPKPESGFIPTEDAKFQKINEAIGQRQEQNKAKAEAPGTRGAAEKAAIDASLDAEVPDADIPLDESTPVSEAESARRQELIDLSAKQPLNAAEKAELDRINGFDPEPGTDNIKIAAEDMDEALKSGKAIVEPAPGNARSVTEDTPPATAVDQEGTPLDPEWVKSVADRVQGGGMQQLESYDPALRTAVQAELDARKSNEAGNQPEGRTPEEIAQRSREIDADMLAAQGEKASGSDTPPSGSTENPRMTDVPGSSPEDSSEPPAPEVDASAGSGGEAPPEQPPAPPSPEPENSDPNDDGNEVRNDGVPQGSTWEGRTKKQQNADRSPDGDPQTNTKLDLRTEGTEPSANDGAPEMPASSDGGDQPPEEPPAPDATPPGEEPDPAGPLHEAMGDHTDDQGRQEEQAAGSAPLDLAERSAQIDQEMREGADQGRAILEQPPAPREPDEPITNDTDLQQVSDGALDAEINRLEGIQDRDLTPEEANQLMRLQDERDERIEFGERTLSSEDMTSDEIEAEIADLEGLDNPSEENSARLAELRATREDRQTGAEQGEPTDPFRSKLEQDRARKQEIIDRYRNGEDISEGDMDIIASDLRRNETVQDKLDKGEELNAYEADLAQRYGLTARERPTPGNERDNKIRELEAAIQRGEATPEQRSEYMRLRAEADQEKKDVNERDILRSKLLTEGSLNDEEKTRLDELEGKLQNRELTPAERGKEIDRLALKMADDLMNGRAINDGDIERYDTLKAEQAVAQSGVESGREAIMKQIKENLANKRLREKKETAVEKRTKEKLAELMNLEMQMLAIPRQLEALAQSQKNLKRDIERKKAEVGRFSNKQEAQQKRRTELYPLMMALAQNKGLIGHYKNHSLVLRAAYKGAMADLNRTLKLNGRFGIVQDVFQHIDSMISRAYADIKTDYDSIYASDAKNAQKAA